jgi:DNA-binding response OmpR family regulator
MKNLVAVLDDEPDILELVSVNLQNAGFETALFEEAASLFSFLQDNSPKLLVLDLMLPKTDGFEVCKQIRNTKSTSKLPIIMLTAKTDITDKVLGLEFGADDYITKPFSPKELIARVKAILRRSSKVHEQTEIIEFGEILKIDLSKFKVLVKNIQIDLTSTEFKILGLLTKRESWVYSRNQILDHLWGNDKIVVDRTVDVHIRNLRSKLGDAGKFIKNIRSIGYKFEV